MRAAQKLLGVPTIGGGKCPTQGVVVEGVEEVKYAPMLPRMYKKSAKTGGFAHFFCFLLKGT